MPTYVKYKFAGRLRDWGKAIYINDYCIAERLTKDVTERYVPGFGNIVELEVQDWVFKKDRYRGILRLELDENDMYKNPAKKKEWQEIINQREEE